VIPTLDHSPSHSFEGERESTRAPVSSDDAARACSKLTYSARPALISVLPYFACNKLLQHIITINVMSELVLSSTALLFPFCPDHNNKEK